MRKEVLIAIILGFALGLVITFGIWSANRAMKEKEAPQVAEEPTPVVQAPTITPSLSLAIISPEDESLQTKEKALVSGTTEPEANVVIISAKTDEVIQADETGKFETEVTLENGTNEISITAIDSEGNEATKMINVVYSAEE